MRHCYSLLNSLLFQTGPLYQKLVVFVSLKAMNVLATDISTSFFASTLKKDKNFVSNVIIYNNESIDNRIEILVLFFLCYDWTLGSTWAPYQYNFTPGWMGGSFFVKSPKLAFTICLFLTTFKAYNFASWSSSFITRFLNLKLFF